MACIIQQNHHQPAAWDETSGAKLTDNKRTLQNGSSRDVAFLSKQQPIRQQGPQQQQQITRRATKRGPYSSASQFSHKIELYRGSVSTVYKALDETCNQRVILKCYHKSKMQEKHFHKLDREIQAMQAMRGPYVADLYGWFQDEASVWLVMELCEGGDLFKCMMVHGGRLDEFYVCTEIIAPLLRVLEKSHTQCFMHRDIKPENIFLTKGNRLRLGDFGLAVNWTLELPFSRSGTLDYMAPEVLRNPATTMQEGPRVPMAALDQRGIKPYDEKVDVWAVGVLAYELVVGKPPFEVEDEAQTASLIMYSHAIRFPSAYSPLWADFVRTVLVKDPKQRPSASQLMQHAWITHHIQSAILKAAAQGRVSSKQQLLKPFPLIPASEWANTPSLKPAAVLEPAPSTPAAALAPAARSAAAPGSGHGSAPCTPAAAGRAAPAGLVSPTAAPGPRPQGVCQHAPPLPPRTPHQPVNSSGHLAAACRTQPVLHAGQPRMEPSTPTMQHMHSTRADPFSTATSFNLMGDGAVVVHSSPFAGAHATQVATLRTHALAHVTPPDSPTVNCPTALERARSCAPASTLEAGSSSGMPPAAQSTFAYVSAALEAAATHGTASSDGPRAAAPPFLVPSHASPLSKSSSTGVSDMITDSSGGGGSILSSSSTTTTAVAASSGLARPYTAAPRGHGCVLVGRSAAPGPGKHQLSPAVLRSVDLGSSYRQQHAQQQLDARVEQDVRMEPAYSPRPASAAGPRLPLGLHKLHLADMAGCSATEGGPLPEVAMASPALPAGRKERSLAHLKHQAWT